MKELMNNKMIKASFTALVLTVLVGCGNKAVAPAPIPPPTNPQYGGGGGCGGGVSGQANSYFGNLINVTQQGQGVPSSMNLTFTPIGTQNIGPNPGQQAQVSGCFNWADLPMYFGGGGGFGQPQNNNIQTAIQLTSQSPAIVQSTNQYAMVNNLTLVGQTSLPSWGAASSSTTIMMIVRQAYLVYGGQLVIQQPAQVFVNGQPQMPTGAPAPAFVTPQQ